MSTPVVRDARPSDALDLGALLTQLGYPTGPQQATERLARFAARAHATALVAIESERIVGLATAHMLALLTDGSDVAMLTALVVLDGARRGGIGRALVTHVEKWAKQLGACRIMVTTALRRADAHAFYEKLGWEFTGRRYGRDL
jgi:GNAT superfamily N-acetyltransferase